MRADPFSIIEAQRLLGLTGPANASVLTAAFRTAVKAARPDAPGGDADRFRRVIAAYRLLQTRRAALPAPAHAPAAGGAAVPRAAPACPPPLLALTPLQALFGGSLALTITTRRLLVHTPPGLRSGDRLRLRGVPTLIPVLIRPADGLSVLGGDLFMEAPVPSRILRDGGRIEIDTHAGPRPAWLVPDMVEPVRLRLKGLGLPARGARPAGDLFVKLTSSDDLPSAAEDMLARFTRLWTPERLAA